jgi:hypothetical protein
MKCENCNVALEWVYTGDQLCRPCVWLQENDPNGFVNRRWQFNLLRAWGRSVVIVESA